MVIAVGFAMGKLKSHHWKLTDEQYTFCRKLLNLYRLHTGHKFDKRLRGWLFFNQKRRLHAADFLAFLSLFDLCADEEGIKCGVLCPDYRICQEIYEIISNRSDYSPNKIGNTDNSFLPESPTIHGQAAELLKLLDSFRP